MSQSLVPRLLLLCVFLFSGKPLGFPKKQIHISGLRQDIKVKNRKKPHVNCSQVHQLRSSSQAHQASQVLNDWLFYVFSFMFKPSQREMRPLSVLRTSFPIKGQEAVVAWKFSLGLSALAFPAPSRGRMPARQEGVFTKRLSDKQYIMKAESLLEHKGVFLVFVFYRTPIIIYPE